MNPKFKNIINTKMEDAATYIVRSSQQIETFKFLEVTTAHADQVVDLVHAHNPVCILRASIPVRETPHRVIVFLTLRASSRIQIGASVTRFA